MKILTRNFQDMIVVLPSDDFWNLASLDLIKHQLVVPLHDHGHPIIAYMYNLSKHEDKDLKLSGYDEIAQPLPNR